MQSAEASAAEQLAAYTTAGQFTEGLRYLLEGIGRHGDSRGTRPVTMRRRADRRDVYLGTAAWSSKHMT